MKVIRQTVVPLEIDGYLAKSKKLVVFDGPEAEAKEKFRKEADKFIADFVRNFGHSPDEVSENRVSYEWSFEGGEQWWIKELLYLE